MCVHIYIYTYIYRYINRYIHIYMFTHKRPLLFMGFYYLGIYVQI
jgi:hypothetical protein